MDNRLQRKAVTPITLRLPDPTYFGIALLTLLASGHVLEAGQQVAPPAAQTAISRSTDGKVTVRAVRVATPLRVDGRLDDEGYQTQLPMSGFIQAEPRNGEAASQDTHVWMFFDDRNVYFGIRAWESNLEGMIANDMRRDGSSLPQNEYVSLMIDTFHDLRNGVGFAVTPIGGSMDGQVQNERTFLQDWNTIWDFAVGRFEGGWTAEIAIPFKSLRYRPGREQVWGLHVQRQNRWKNEISYLVPMSNANAIGSRAVFQMSMAATVLGLEAPPVGKNFEIKPYAISNLITDRTVVPRISNDVTADAGIDAKYGITQSLTADFTYNTDFAQVEADEQQVNLTRFSLFFPEKREFFLENQGMFGFGGNDMTGRESGDIPVLFYSRRIGLNNSRVVPLLGGARVTGRAGTYSLGAVSIRTDDEPLAQAQATTFSVMRVKRDILRRSFIGAMATSRSRAQAGGGHSETYGVDGGFVFGTNLNINSYWARTATPGRSGDAASYRAQLDYTADRYGAQVEHLLVGRNFNPEIGFVRRPDMRETSTSLRFSPRPKNSRVIRKYSLTANGSHVANGAGRLETRTVGTGFSIELQNSDRWNANYNNTYEFLPRPFSISRGITLPVGGYTYGAASTGFTFGQHRRLYGSVNVEQGTFYSGNRTTLSIRQGRIRVSPQLALEPSLSINWVDLPQGSFTTKLTGLRITYAITPKMFVGALLQYNTGSNTMATNARLRWEYQPGSELFVVYNDQRDTSVPGFPDTATKAFIVKINRLLRF